MLFEFFLDADSLGVVADLVGNRSENFEDDRNEDVELDEDDGDPEGNEVDAHPDHAALPHDRRVLVHCQEPVVDHHLVEQHDQRGSEIVEIERVVERGSPMLMILTVRQFAPEQQRSQLRIDVENKVDKEELAQDGLRDHPRRFHDQSDALHLAREKEDSRAPQQEQQRDIGEVPVNGVVKVTSHRVDDQSDGAHLQQ
eukprot:CAMPEP_0170464610 /NCGR_PEP_ID=MMETSP0123-20130129/9265_1 /TAXON_ID=182087 /ORGANISM="Favella ehrenbergii, Strain Fehren 1" /LENGTH=197 /DNA_ID=CAMNT_0010730301 /DNA_START=1095 /DNA_END=1688 /DNA_ORIENTATION=-